MYNYDTRTAINKIKSLLKVDDILLADLQCCNDGVLVFLHGIVRKFRSRKQTHTLKSKVSAMAKHIGIN